MCYVLARIYDIWARVVRVARSASVSSWHGRPHVAGTVSSGMRAATASMTPCRRATEVTVRHLDHYVGQCGAAGGISESNGAAGPSVTKRTGAERGRPGAEHRRSLSLPGELKGELVLRGTRSRPRSVWQVRARSTVSGDSNRSPSTSLTSMAYSGPSPPPSPPPTSPISRPVGTSRRTAGLAGPLEPSMTLITAGLSTYVRRRWS